MYYISLLLFVSNHYMQNEVFMSKQNLTCIYSVNSIVCLSSYWEIQTFEVLHEINMLRISTSELTPTLIFHILKE